jgi:hypothetical protein
MTVRSRYLIGEPAAHPGGRGQIGQCLGPAETGADGGVGGGSSGEPGGIPAVGPVRVGRRGDPPPCGPDLVVGEPGPGWQA